MDNRLYGLCHSAGISRDLTQWSQSFWPRSYCAETPSLLTTDMESEETSEKRFLPFIDLGINRGHAIPAAPSSSGLTE